MANWMQSKEARKTKEKAKAMVSVGAAGKWDTLGGSVLNGSSCKVATWQR